MDVGFQYLITKHIIYKAIENTVREKILIFIDFKIQKLEGMSI